MTLENRDAKRWSYMECNETAKCADNSDQIEMTSRH